MILLHFVSLFMMALLPYHDQVIFKGINYVWLCTLTLLSALVFQTPGLWFLSLFLTASIYSLSL